MHSGGWREVSGFLVVDKPAGLTSHDVVDRVRKRFGCRKVGHGGTLDPMATGLLVLGIGRAATRKLSAVMGADKVYEAVMMLGVRTDTQDATGSVVCRGKWEGIRSEKIEEVMEGFVGRIRQVPPMYSALKKDGIPLYRLARRGVEVPRKARDVVVHGIDITACSLPEVAMRIHCSKGTYIRTLCADSGKKLGCGAHCCALRRVRAGSYSIDDAVRWEDLMRMKVGEFVNALHPVTHATT